MLNQNNSEDKVDLSLIEKSAELENPQGRDRLAKHEEQKLINDNRRGEEYRKHIHRIVVISMYVIGIIMIILLVVRAFHFIVPTCWRWLDEKDLHNIERIIFSGIILSLSAKYFKKYKVLED